eukprot:TRINITY_DN5955_c0_g1_i17.p1 TRINITY_DN5955_c0_g1~~TRINITY_DN5955_c0_g1_i17.p1  ORF type:complete len:514 (-),score=74.43 TRINITY_DN5955_c0_g1_i17:1536-3002(-)
MSSPLHDRTDIINRQVVEPPSFSKSTLKQAEKVKEGFEKKELPTDYQAFIHATRYARWLPEKQRRETWSETVSRYFDFMAHHLSTTYDFKLTQELRSELETAVLELQIMPSMRAIMTAGQALERCHVAGYNCSYLPIDDPCAFDEILFILMNGTGVGFSVEEQYISKLPKVADEVVQMEEVVVVEDSREGWAKALRKILSNLYKGRILQWDTQNIRPKGARLNTFGGTASGPGPLISLFEFATDLFTGAKGRQLTALECHREHIVNRDIKLENTLRYHTNGPQPGWWGHGDKCLRDSHVWSCKLCDFGYSKDTLNNSAPTSRVGSLPYASPEVLYAQPGEQYDGEKRDVWACGVMLYCLLVTSYPFDPRKYSQPMLFELIRKANYKFPTNCDISQEARRLVSCMIKPDPKKRYSIDEVVAHPWFQKNLPADWNHDFKETVAQKQLTMQTDQEIERMVDVVFEQGKSFTIDDELDDFLEDELNEDFDIL